MFSIRVLFRVLFIRVPYYIGDLIKGTLFFENYPYGTDQPWRFLTPAFRFAVCRSDGLRVGKRWPVPLTGLEQSSVIVPKT